MRVLNVLCWLAVGLLSAACASQEPEKELDFFERLAKNQEERESARRDAQLARSKGKEPKLEKGDGTLEYYRRSKQQRGPRAAIRVTWEGLAREREIAANSKYNRPRGTVAPPMKITLVSESHPDAPTLRAGRTKDSREEGAHSAVLRDADLVRFVEGLDKRGFFQHARATDAQQNLFGNARARGRVTIERGNQSVTLVSMRGQGLDPRTKAIPGIYSESKQAIMMLRNRTPGLALSGVATDTVLPGFGN